MLNAQYLLVCATEKRHVPGKLFEYLRTGNKIIAFGDDNTEVAGILQQANAGKLFHYNYNKDDILSLVDTTRPNPEAAKIFSRENIAHQFDSLLSAC
jgi:hypothetical protein